MLYFEYCFFHYTTKHCVKLLIQLLNIIVKGVTKLLGIDLIEIDRVRKVIKKHSNFLNRIFGDEEILHLKEKGFLIQSIAGNFCAKEAFLKSVGIGISRNINLKCIEILRNEKNAPYIKIKEDNTELKKYKNVKFSVSIAHTKNYATAVVIGQPKKD